MNNPSIAFDYMNKDKIVGRVEVYGDKVNYRCYSNNISDIIFLDTDEPNIEQLVLFLEDRIVPETRDGVNEIVKSLGLEEYDILSICEKTKGVMYDDYNWIRFDGDTSTWEDVDPRPKIKLNNLKRTVANKRQTSVISELIKIIESVGDKLEGVTKTQKYKL